MWKHCINSLIENIFIFFIFGTPCGRQIRDQTHASLQWKSRVLTIGPVEKSWNIFLSDTKNNSTSYNLFFLDSIQLNVTAFLPSLVPPIFKKMHTCAHVSMCVCVCAQLCPTLFDPMDCSLPCSSVRAFLQARILSGLPFPSLEDLPKTEIKPTSPALAGRFFTASATWEALF